MKIKMKITHYSTPYVGNFYIIFHDMDALYLTTVGHLGHLKNILP